MIYISNAQGVANKITLEFIFVISFFVFYQNLCLEFIVHELIFSQSKIIKCMY